MGLFFKKRNGADAERQRIRTARKSASSQVSSSSLPQELSSQYAARGRAVRKQRYVGFAKGANAAGAGLLRGFARQRRRQIVFARDVRRPLVGSGVRKQGRGRPRGSYSGKYRDSAGNPIDVYTYRKLLNARLRVERLQALRNATVNPQQQAILAQIEARQRAEQQAPEARTIPDTSGQIPLRSFDDEINDAANAVP